MLRVKVLIKRGLQTSDGMMKNLKNPRLWEQYLNFGHAYQDCLLDEGCDGERCVEERVVKTTEMEFVKIHYRKRRHVQDYDGLNQTHDLM